MPREHPYYGVPHDDAPVQAHGGLTYSARCNGDICHVPEPGMPDDVWWFGFDCGHFQDVVPAIDITMKFEDSTYRDLAYVTAEICDLAEQLREKESDDVPAAVDDAFEDETGPEVDDLTGEVLSDEPAKGEGSLVQKRRAG